MCGIYGVVRHNECVLGEKRFKSLVERLGHAAMIRGTDATGVGFIDPELEGKATAIKKPIPASDFPFMRWIPNEVKALVGHTRLTTHGSAEYIPNNHPFFGRTRDGKPFVFAHNGIISNYKELQDEHKLPPTEIQTDSYVVAQLLEQEFSINKDSVARVSEKLQGDFMIPLVTEDKIYFIKGGNPVYIARFKEFDFTVYGSTIEIVEEALKQDRILYRYYQYALGKGDVEEVEDVLVFDGEIIEMGIDTSSYNVIPFEYDEGAGAYSWMDYACGLGYEAEDLGSTNTITGGIDYDEED